MFREIYALEMIFVILREFSLRISRVIQGQRTNIAVAPYATLRKNLMLHDT